MATAPVAPPRPFTDPSAVDHQTRMARRALTVFVVVMPISVTVAWLLRDLRGALTALAVHLFVLIVFLSTAWSLRCAARRGPTMVQATALGGAIFRLTLYGLLAVTLAPTDVLDPPTLALAAPLAILTLLAAEVALVLADPSFRMVDADAGRRTTNPAPPTNHAATPPDTTRTNE